MPLRSASGSSPGFWRKRAWWGAGVPTAVVALLTGTLVGFRLDSEAAADSPPAALWPSADNQSGQRVPVAVPPTVTQVAPILPPPSLTVSPSLPPLELPTVVIDPSNVVPAGGLQPKDPAPKEGEPLPQPRPFPFDEGRVRLPRLGTPPGLGTTPVPTEEELKEYSKYIEGVIDPRNTLDLIVGRARVVLLRATPTRTQIADPSIATFRLLEPQGRQMTIIGSRVGTTVLNLWFVDPDNKDREKILSYLVRVLPDPEEKERLEAIYRILETEINKAFPQSRVRLALVGDKVMISGQAHDVGDAAQILQVVAANAPGATGAATRPPISNITPTTRPGDPLRPDPTPGLQSFIPEGANVINNLRIPGEQQVQLRVTVAEVNRAAARSIGLNFSIINNQGLAVFSQLTGGLAGGGGVGAGGVGAGGVGAGAGGAGGAGGNLPINLDNGQIPVALNALRTLNYARSLAEPNLTTLNGRIATFQAGGQFPIPVVTGFGGAVGALQGVQFIPFGVQLAFTPIITDRDRIRLTLNATVSTRDNGGGANIGGAAVPGLNTRTFQTTVELREGQTMAVAGLIQNSLGADSTRVPLLGDIPYFGRFWSVDQTSSGEQELIVLVTPELVHPLEPHELSPLPGSDIFEPGDLEFYLAGRMESRRSYDYRSTVRTDIHRMLRYRRCEDVYIVGPSGHVDPPAPGAAPPVGKKDSWLDVLPIGKR